MQQEINEYLGGVEKNRASLGNRLDETFASSTAQIAQTQTAIDKFEIEKGLIISELDDKRRNLETFRIAMDALAQRAGEVIARQTGALKAEIDTVMSLSHDKFIEIDRNVRVISEKVGRGSASFPP